MVRRSHLRWVASCVDRFKFNPTPKSKIQISFNGYKYNFKQTGHDQTTCRAIIASKFTAKCPFTSPSIPKPTTSTSITIDNTKKIHQTNLGFWIKLKQKLIKMTKIMSLNTQQNPPFCPPKPHPHYLHPQYLSYAHHNLTNFSLIITPKIWFTRKIKRSPQKSNFSQVIWIIKDQSFDAGLLGFICRW